MSSSKSISKQIVHGNRAKIFRKKKVQDQSEEQQTLRIVRESKFCRELTKEYYKVVEEKEQLKDIVEDLAWRNNANEE